MKLIRFHWTRPDMVRRIVDHNGIYSQECEDDQVEEMIEERKSLCFEENLDRIITKIEIYSLEEVRTNDDPNLND